MCSLTLRRLIVSLQGGGPRVVVSTAAFHARVRGSVPDLGGFKETKMFLPHPRVKVSIVGSLRDREVACSASDRQGSNFESCVWRTVSSHSSHHPQEVLLAQFSLYVHKGGLKPDSFHFVSLQLCIIDPSPTNQFTLIHPESLFLPINTQNDGIQLIVQDVTLQPFSKINIYFQHRQQNGHSKILQILPFHT